MVQAAVDDVARSDNLQLDRTTRGKASRLAHAVPPDEAQDDEEPRPVEAQRRHAAAEPRAAVAQRTRRARHTLGTAAIIEMVAFAGVVLLSIDATLALIAERPLSTGHWFVVGLMAMMALAGLVGGGLAATRALRARVALRRREP